VRCFRRDQYRLRIAAAWLRTTVVRNCLIVVGASFALYYRPFWSAKVALPTFRSHVLSTGAEHLDVNAKTELLVMATGLEEVAKRRSWVEDLKFVESIEDKSFFMKVIHQRKDNWK
jgi:hypothetical protein